MFHLYIVSGARTHSKWWISEIELASSRREVLNWYYNRHLGVSLQQFGFTVVLFLAFSGEKWSWRKLLKHCTKEQWENVIWLSANLLLYSYIFRQYYIWIYHIIYLTSNIIYSISANILITFMLILTSYKNFTVYSLLRRSWWLWKWTQDCLCKILYYSSTREI